MTAKTEKRAVIMGLCIALLICIYVIAIYTGSHSSIPQSRIFMVINAIILGLNIGIIVLALILKRKQELRFRFEETKKLHELIKNRELAAERLSLDTEKLKAKLGAELKRARGMAEARGAGIDKENTETEWDERYCLNTLADTVLKLKADECGKKGISIAINADIPAGLGLSETELCSLLSNLLDNAIEACEGGKGAYIRFNAGMRKDYLYISVSNTASEEHAKRGLRAGRGLGLKIVDNIARGHGGELFTGFDGKEFKAEVVAERV